MKRYIERGAARSSILHEDPALAYAIDRVPDADVPIMEWISVKDHLPEQPYGCLLIVWDSPYDGGDDFLNYLPYFAGWDGERWNDGDGMQVPFEVEYWMPLPAPPKEARNA